MRILVIGLGSIGSRHTKNLIASGYKDLSIVTTKTVLPAELNYFIVYQTLDQALSSKTFDAAFICTPTAHHTKHLIALLKKKVQHIYIEKPLSNTVSGFDKILKLINDYSPDIAVGYDLHFEPGLEKVKDLLRKDSIGKIISVNAFAGQHLSQWRADEDYRTGMSAKKETGGGVMFDLIHEVDYLVYLLGKATNVACLYTNSTALEIETEEAAEILIKFSNQAIATIHLDYFQPVLKRYCIFTGTTGTIEWNLAETKVIITNQHAQKEEFSYNDFMHNDRFMAIVQTFLQNPKDERLTRFSEAAKSLNIVLAAKYAAENNCFVDMEAFNPDYN